MDKGMLVLGSAEESIGWTKGDAMVILRDPKIWDKLEDDTRAATNNWDSGRPLDMGDLLILKAKLTEVTKTKELKKQLEETEES